MQEKSIDKDIQINQMCIPKELIKALKSGQRFLLMAHQKPDGDAVGSVAAFGAGLKSLGKHVDYYLDTIEEKLHYLPETQYFNGPELSAYDAAVYLDCSSSDFAKRPQNMPQVDRSIVIDHHLSNEGYGDINFIKIAGATGELVYGVLKALGADITDEVAQAIFTAISADTGSFQFSNTTPQTHEITAKLLEGGRSFSPVSKALHTQKSYEETKLYGEAVHTMTLYDEGRIAIYGLDHDTITKYGGTGNISDDVSNIGVNIKTVILSVFAKEVKPGEYRLSLRSKSPYPIDVSRAAVAYGGGGHMRAAGCSFTGSYNDMVDAFLPRLTQMIEESK